MKNSLILVWPMVTFSLWLALQLVESKPVVLSNLHLPVDQNEDAILTGETSILQIGDSYYYYVNNWGGCESVDCCPSPEGCASCCYVPPTPRYPDTCVFTTNHSVYVYRTKDFQKFENLGIRESSFDRMLYPQAQTSLLCGLRTGQARYNPQGTRWPWPAPRLAPLRRYPKTLTCQA